MIDRHRTRSRNTTDKMQMTANDLPPQKSEEEGEKDCHSRSPTAVPNDRTEIISKNGGRQSRNRREGLTDSKLRACTVPHDRPFLPSVLLGPPVCPQDREVTLYSKYSTPSSSQPSKHVKHILHTSSFEIRCSDWRHPANCSHSGRVTSALLLPSVCRPSATACWVLSK